MKILLRLALLALVLIAGLAIALYFFLPPASKAAVKKGSQALLGVEASIEQLPFSLSASAARVGMDNLLIPNPTQFGAAPFLKVGHASIELDTFSVLRKVVRVQEIRLEGTHLHLIQKGAESNLHWFLQRMPGRDTQEVGLASPAEDEGDGKLLAVERVVITGLTAELTVKELPLGTGSWKAALPPLDLDLSSAEPGNSADLMRTILTEIVANGLRGLEAKLPPEARQILQQDQLQRLIGEVLGSALKLDGAGVLGSATGETAQEAFNEVLRNLPGQLPQKSPKFKDLLPD